MWFTVLRRFLLNIQALKAKIKLQKNTYGMVTFLKQVRKTYREFGSDADPAREN